MATAAAATQMRIEIIPVVPSRTADARGWEYSGSPTVSSRSSSTHGLRLLDRRASCVNAQEENPVSMRGVAFVAGLAGFLKRDDLVEDDGEHAQPRRAQDAQPIGDLAEPQQPIVIGILVVFRRIERVDLMGGVGCVDQRLAHGSDRKLERLLGGTNAGGVWSAHGVLILQQVNLPEACAQRAARLMSGGSIRVQSDIGTGSRLLPASGAGLSPIDINELECQPTYR